MRRAIIGFGTNLGDRRAIIARALSAVSELIGDVLAVSSIQETPPMTHPDFDVPEQGPYLNGAVLVATSCEPEVVLDTLLAIESELGRKRSTAVKWGPRIIDLDLLLVDDIVLTTLRLTIPHPGMLYRDFVLGPICELWPDWQHPQEHRSVRELFNELAQESDIVWRLPHAAARN